MWLLSDSISCRNELVEFVCGNVELSMRTSKIKETHLSLWIKAIPPFRGKKRLVAYLLQRLWRSEDSYVRGKEGNVLHVPSLREPLAQHLFIDGVYESETCAFLKKSLDCGDIFFDIGANVGYFSLMAGKLVGDTGLVYAFEASPRIADYLTENIELNYFKNIKAFNFAVSDKTNNDVLFYEAPRQKFGMGSLSAQFAAHPTKVKSMSLDDFVSDASGKINIVIKVDVEGHEAAVFRGAKRFLKSFKPIIVFEFCDWAEKRAGYAIGEAQRVLLEFGYQLWDVKSYLKNSPPKDAILTSGFTMLVARKAF